MSRTSSAVKNRYNSKAYDRITIIVPKGRKTTIEEYAKEKGESVTALIARLLRAELGIKDEDWKLVQQEGE